MRKKIVATSVVIGVMFMFIGCGGGSDGTINSGGTNPNPSPNPVSAPEDAATLLESESKNIGNLVNVVDLPVMPTREIAKSSVAGIDANNNGTRDELEHIVFQGLNILPNVGRESYNQTLVVINMLQPKEPPVENSINEHDIYCSHRLLLDEIKEELPLEFLYNIVLDTQERKNAFNSSLQASIVSLGAESCE